MPNQEFRIYYKNRQRYALLILGAILLMIGVGVNLYFEEGELSFILGIGLAYTLIGIYRCYQPYVKVKEGFLWFSSNPFRKIKISEIEKVKQFLDETTLFVNGKETIISDLMMSEADKKRFSEFINGINPI
ncbi:MAG: hypothetical protein KDB74_05770 [Flavobacteriales bacterium]|nr:hypothetical protein [Flavobacteriales bacterium]